MGSSVANPDYPDTDPNPVVYLPPLAVPSFPFAYGEHLDRHEAGRQPRSTSAVSQADDRPITADAGGPYAGTEGVPIVFDASGTTVGCGTPPYHWEFSDGGSADGAQPSHTFADNGTYTGTVTANRGRAAAIPRRSR